MAIQLIQKGAIRRRSPFRKVLRSIYLPKIARSAEVLPVVTSRNREIEYTVNEKSMRIAPKITDKGASSIQS